MTNGEIIEVAASEGTSESPCSPASEGYPEGWWHCTIHLNPETGEMHSDGDHRVRTWIQDKLANISFLGLRGRIFGQYQLTFFVFSILRPIHAHGLSRSFE